MLYKYIILYIYIFFNAYSFVQKYFLKTDYKNLLLHIKLNYIMLLK